MMVYDFDTTSLKKFGFLVKHWLSMTDFISYLIMLLNTMGLPIGNKIINNVFHWKNVLRPDFETHGFYQILPLGSRQRRDLRGTLIKYCLLTILSLLIVFPHFISNCCPGSIKTKHPTVQAGHQLASASHPGILKLSSRLHSTADPQHYTNLSRKSGYPEWSWDQQQGHELETCQKCRISGPPQTC